HYSKRISGEPVIIPEGLRQIVGQKIIEKIQALGYRILALAVAGMHCHFLAELPDDLGQVRQIVGQCKWFSSHAVRARLPGRVWARDGAYKPVDTPEYQRNVLGYILDQEGPGHGPSGMMSSRGLSLRGPRVKRTTRGPRRLGPRLEAILFSR